MPEPVAPLTVGVLGAGTMGAGIAQVAATASHPVLLYDIADAPLQRGLDGIAAFLRQGVERGKMPADTAEVIRGRIKGTTDLAKLAPCGLIVEAAPEILDLKRKMFADLAAIVAPSCVLASNTSTLSIASIARDVPQPGRVCGMHFFNPAPLMPLVEVIRGAQTADETVERVMDLAAAWGKEPVACSDTPGFIVNRVARPLYGEALALLGNGVADVATIDRLARDAGFPMGPFELMDLIGIDVNFAAAQSVYEGYFHEPRFRPHPIQRQMVDGGRLGRKTDQGYYRYVNGRLEVAESVPPPATVTDTGSSGQRLRIAVVGPDPMRTALSERLAAAGIEVIHQPEDDDHVADWATNVRSAHAAIDVTVSDRKQGALGPFGRMLPPGAPLLTCCHATNATAAATMADGHADRVTGFALLPPWEDRRTVECARAQQTSDAAVQAADAIWRAAGFEPVWVGDSTGLVLPRIVACLANEAAFAVQEGVAAADGVDRAMKLGTRYPRGPLEWAREVGLNEILATLDALAEDVDPARYRAASVLRRAVVGGRDSIERN